MKDFIGNEVHVGSHVVFSTGDFVKPLAKGVVDEIIDNGKVVIYSEDHHQIKKYFNEIIVVNDSEENWYYKDVNYDKYENTNDYADDIITLIDNASNDIKTIICDYVNSFNNTDKYNDINIIDNKYKDNINYNKNINYTKFDDINNYLI